MQKGISVQYPYRRQGGVAHVGGVGVAQVPGAAGLAGGGALGGLLDAALNAGGRIGEILAREYRGLKTAEVDEVLLGVDREFELWKQDYKASRRGSLAANAAGDFAARYGELAEAALRDFGHEGEVFHDALKSRLAGHALLALRDGGAHQARELEVWKSSQLEGQMASFAAMAAASPLDVEAMDHERRQLMGAWELKNPGQDPRAFIQRLDREEARARVEAMLADNGLLEQAGALIEGGYRSDPRGVAGPRPGSQSERALAANNFGFVKGVDGRFASYATRADGLAAIGGRFLRYANAPERGWQAQTLEQAMNIYAPASDGNDVNAYLSHLEQLTGIKRGERINFRDPEVLATLIQAIPQHEHGSFAVIGRDEALAAAQKALNGDIRQGRARDQLAGLSPAERERYGQVLERRRRQAAEADELTRLGEKMAEDAKASPERRLLTLYDYLGGIADPALRETLRRAGVAQLKFEWDRAEAGHRVEADELLKSMAGMNPLEAATHLRRSNASAGAIAIARKAYFANEGKETVENRSWTDNALKAIDAGKLESPEEREQFCRAHGLTLQQTRSVLNYRGKMADVSRDDIFKAMQAMGCFVKMPPDVEDLVASQLPNGRKPSKQELQQAVAKLFMRGMVKRQDRLYYQALQRQEAGQWLPVVDKNEVEMLDAHLEALGLARTPRNRALLKRQRKTGIGMDEE